MIVAVPAFADNYIWIIRPGHHRKVSVVDPGDAAPVIRFLQKHGLSIGAILVTHHHADHVGGVDDLLAYAAQTHGLDATPKVYGPAHEAISCVNVPLREGDEVWLEGHDTSLRVMEVPGHTAGHIAYFGQIHDDGPSLFCGDTLFAAGCGRLFEGSAEQMWSSLQKLKALPKETLVFCAHEYTLSNLRFAAHALPSHDAIAQRLSHVKAMRDRGEITLPSTIETEIQSNPFLLCGDAVSFAAMRQDKDRFRG